MDLFNSWLVETPIAHRGVHDKQTPENSMSAFKKAIDEGYAIELDVRTLSDGTVVVFHDDSLARLTGNDGYLKFLKKSDLEMLSLGETNEKIPTLEEVLSFVDGKTPILIDIKNMDKVGELEANVLNILKDYKGKFAVHSENPYTLNFFYKHAPQILRGQKSGSFKNYNIRRIYKKALQKMTMNDKVSHPDFIVYEAKELPNRFVKKYKTLPLLAFTIKSQEEYLKTVKYCDNIIFENFDPKI